MKRQNGFTLIEIAIVLVIIGLLLGGVLKGQEMITQAKIRNVANDFNGTSAAYYAYQDRYRAMPGDDPNAATRWTAASGTVGNGDAKVSGEYNSAADTDESRLFWLDLRLAGLTAGPTSGAGAKNQPQNAAGGMTGVTSLGMFGLNGLVVCSDNLPGKIANAIDSQFDDGVPNTGSVRAGVVPAGGATTPHTLGAAQPAYVDDGSTMYIVCKNI